MEHPRGKSTSRPGRGAGAVHALPFPRPFLPRASAPRAQTRHEALGEGRVRGEHRLFGTLFSTLFGILFGTSAGGFGDGRSRRRTIARPRAYAIRASRGAAALTHEVVTSGGSARLSPSVSATTPRTSRSRCRARARRRDDARKVRGGVRSASVADDDSLALALLRGGDVAERGLEARGGGIRRSHVCTTARRPSSSASQRRTSTSSVERDAKMRASRGASSRATADALGEALVGRAVVRREGAEERAGSRRCRTRRRATDDGVSSCETAPARRPSSCPRPRVRSEPHIVES